jgi:hypothetical protein
MHIQAPQQTKVSKQQQLPPPPEMVYSPSVAETGKRMDDAAGRYFPPEFSQFLLEPFDTPNLSTHRTD